MFYIKRDDFNFEIVNFPIPDGDVPRSGSKFFTLREVPILKMDAIEKNHFLMQ